MTIPKPGIYENVPSDEYFGWECFSKSMIPHIMRSAKHLKHYLQGNYQKEAFVIGSLADAMILDPVELGKYGVLPDTYVDVKTGKEKPWNGNSTVCKRVKQEMIDFGQTPIKSEIWQGADRIKEAVLENKTASELLRMSKNQVSMVWEDPDTGVLCRSRIDALNAFSLTDLKTTRNASPGKFAKDIYNFGYHEQAALYIDGWKLLTGETVEPQWNFIAVENEQPHGCRVYTLQPESIELGQKAYKKALQRYSEYLKDDPELKQGYPDHAEPIDIPEWALNQNNDYELEEIG